jgi:hypothetical protein
LDNGASCHMIESWELFSGLMERDLDVHVQHGDDAKYAMKGEGIVMLQHKSGGLLDAQDVHYVPGLKKKFLSISTIKDRGFVITFLRGKVLTSRES